MLLSLCAIFGAENKIVVLIYQFVFIAKQTKSLNSQITSLAKRDLHRLDIKPLIFIFHYDHMQDFV